MKKDGIYPIIFMFVLTVVLSFLLIGFAQLTKDRVRANQRLAFERAVVSVFSEGIDITKASGLEINRFFEDKLTIPDNSGGAYCYIQDGKIVGYALVIEGQGFWAPIKGVLGIAPDKKTLTGIEFFEQNETPGLGAEIDKPNFKQQFKVDQKRIIAEKGKRISFVRQGEPLMDNQVYAVTGATQTSTRLEKIINDALTKWQKAVEEE